MEKVQEYLKVVFGEEKAKEVLIKTKIMDYPDEVENG